MSNCGEMFPALPSIDRRGFARQGRLARKILADEDGRGRFLQRFAREEWGKCRRLLGSALRSATGDDFVGNESMPQIRERSGRVRARIIAAKNHDLGGRAEMKIERGEHLAGG